jgi:hypothetical protein
MFHSHMPLKMREKLFVSIHIPKTAGTSFLNALKTGFEPHELQQDYNHEDEIQALADRGVSADKQHLVFLKRNIIESSVEYFRSIRPIDSEIKCIHGHFPAGKYLPVIFERKAIFLTWLREPFDRMLSNYFFWKSFDAQDVVNEFTRQMIQEDWSLEKFCFHPALRNYQSRWFYGFPLKFLSFIGLTEFFEEDLRYLQDHVMRIDLPPHHANKTVTDEHPRKYESMRHDFEKYHAGDVHLYRYAQRKRLQR